MIFLNMNNNDLSFQPLLLPQADAEESQEKPSLERKEYEDSLTPFHPKLLQDLDVFSEIEKNLNALAIKENHANIDNASPSVTKRGFSFTIPSNEKRGFSFSLPTNEKRGFSFSVPTNDKRGFSFSVPINEKRGFSFSLPADKRRGFSFSLPTEDKRGFSFSLPREEKRGFSYALPAVEKKSFSYTFPVTDKRGFSFAEEKRGFSYAFPENDKRAFSFALPSEEKRGFSFTLPDNKKRGFSFAIPENEKRGFSFAIPENEKRGFSFAIPQGVKRVSDAFSVDNQKETLVGQTPGISFAVPKDIATKRILDSPSYLPLLVNRLNGRGSRFKSAEGISQSKEDDNLMSSLLAGKRQIQNNKRGFSFVYLPDGDELSGHAQALHAARVKMAAPALKSALPHAHKDAIGAAAWRPLFRKRSDTNHYSKEQPIQSDNFDLAEAASHSSKDDGGKQSTAAKLSEGDDEVRVDKKGIALLVALPSLGLHRIQKFADSSLAPSHDGGGKADLEHVANGVNHRVLLSPPTSEFSGGGGGGPLNGKSLSRKWKISHMSPLGFFPLGTKRSALQSSIKVKLLPILFVTSVAKPHNSVKIQKCTVYCTF
jgi:hypothetical protein